MKMFLVTCLVFLAALRSSFASLRPLGNCEDAKLNALKEMATTQREKDQEIIDLIQSVEVQKLQTRDEKLTEVDASLNQLSNRLEVLEAKVDTQMDELKNRLESVQTSYEEVLQRIAVFEHQKPQTTEVSIAECPAPFEAVGDDCVFWHNEGMKWEAARSYCKSMGARLIIPTVKEGFELAYGTRSMSVPHPPLIDFLYKKKEKSSGWGNTYGWLSASVDGNNKATWTSGEDLKRGANRINGKDSLRCIAAYVTESKTFGIWTAGCETTFSTPLCQRLK